MRSIIHQLEVLAKRLDANVRPSHCDYISKADAAECCRRIAADLEREYPRYKHAVDVLAKM